MSESFRRYTFNPNDYSSTASKEKTILVIVLVIALVLLSHNHYLKAFNDKLKKANRAFNFTSIKYHLFGCDKYFVGYIVNCLWTFRNGVVN